MDARRLSLIHISWVYPWGEGVSQAEVPQGIGALIAAELLDQQEGYEALADMYAGLKQMDALLPAAREKVNACLLYTSLCRLTPTVSC